mgnify:CR=1 FL=1
MIVKLLFITQFLITGLYANQDSDIYLYIDNFDASGNNVTFDIMIDAKVNVYGAQFDIMSGDGEYNDEDDLLKKIKECENSNDKIKNLNAIKLSKKYSIFNHSKQLAEYLI